VEALGGGAPGPFEDLEMIRREAGVPTSRFTGLIGIPERTYRRWQANARHGRLARGPWPTPAQDRVEQVLVELADQWPAWGHRKITELARSDGQSVSYSTALESAQTHRAGVDAGLHSPAP
jgi:putative transposase